MISENTAARNAAAVYRGKIESALFSGDCEITIEAEGILLDSLFKTNYVPYDSITAISRESHAIHLDTRVSPLKISRLGLDEEAFFLNLCTAFNEKVKRIFQPKGSLLMELKNPAYNYDEREGKAKLQVFRDCILLLSPNLDARRIPFLFVSALTAKNYLLDLVLKTDEQYGLSRLGYDFDPLIAQISDAFRNLRARNAELLEQLDPALSRSQAVQAAQLVPEGIAVPLSELQAHLPTTATVIKEMLAASPLAEYFQALEEITDVSRMAVGFKWLPSAADEAENLEDKTMSADDTEAKDNVEIKELAEPLVEAEAVPEKVSDWALWTVSPAGDGQKAVVEFNFPKEKAATYVFETKGNFESFLITLNRAFEATDFRREMLYLTDSELELEKNANARMLLERTPALQALREVFAGRVIHYSIDSWQKNLQGMLK